MQRKIWCSLVVLAVGAGALAAAEGKQSILLDKSYKALVLQVDDSKHTLVIQCQGSEGKITQKPLLFPPTVNLCDIKPGGKYTFFEQGGRVIAVQPIAVPPSVKKASTETVKATPPKQIIKTPAQPVAKAIIPQTPEKMTALAESRKAEQAKSAANAAVKTKIEAFQAASAKAKSAEKFRTEATQAEKVATHMLKTKEAAVQIAEIRVAEATAAARRAEAVAKLAEAKAALAQTETFQAQAAVKVAMAQVDLAKVDATNAVQAKALAVKFEQAKAAAAKTAEAIYLKAKAAVAKALQEQRAAQQVANQKATAAEKAGARVKQIRMEEEKTLHAGIAVKKGEKKDTVHH